MTLYTHICIPNREPLFISFSCEYTPDGWCSTESVVINGDTYTIDFGCVMVNGVSPAYSIIRFSSSPIS